MNATVRIIVIIAVAALLSACASGTGPVRIREDFPAPVIQPLDFRVGVYYSPEFRKYRHVDTDNAVEFELGSKQTNLFSRVFSALFNQAERVEDPTIPGNREGVFDFVLVPVMEEYAYLSPKDTANQFYAVSIKYHIRVFSAENKLVGYWPFIAYGKNRGGMSGNDSPLGDATDTALRDAAAALVTQFREVVQRQDWQQLTTATRESSG